MATKVRLKFINRQSPPNRSLVLQTAATLLNSPFTRLFDTGDGFKAVCRNQDDVDKILSIKGMTELKKIGLQVVTPPEIRARRSVFVRQLDHDFGKNTAEEIKQELEDKNEWMKIDEVVKIGTYTHVIKIRFMETSMADKALSTGFLGFNLSVAPEQIKREQFVNLLICFACYKYESHATADCPNKATKLCSNCAEDGHIYKDCPNTNATNCLNCVRENRPEANTHRTMAMSCPVKKRMIRTKQDEEKQREENKQNTTYAKIAQQAVKQAQSAPSPTTTIEIGNKTDYQVMVCLLYAHVMNLANPGTFEQEMNILLKLNGMPEMKFPPNPDSGKALRVKGAVLNDPDVAPHLAPERVDVEPTSDSDTDSDATVYTEHTPASQTTPPQSGYPVTTPDPPIKARRQVHTPKTIGLTLLYAKKHPRRYDDNELIAEEIGQGIIKFTYTDPRLSLTDVRALIEHSEINLSREYFTQVDTRVFAKLPMGALMSRHEPATSSPPPVVKGRAKRLAK